MHLTRHPVLVRHTRCTDPNKHQEASCGMHPNFWSSAAMVEKTIDQQTTPGETTFPLFSSAKFTGQVSQCCIILWKGCHQKDFLLHLGHVEMHIACTFLSLDGLISRSETFRPPWLNPTIILLWIPVASWEISGLPPGYGSLRAQMILHQQAPEILRAMQGHLESFAAIASFETWR